MEEYGPVTYGERVADVYDERIARMGIPKDEAVELLAELTQELGAGPVLELAIGTGRIALPLKERDVEVHGVDISDVPVDGSYRLIYLVFNTLFALLTQEEQVRCFENVAGHLEPGGVFVIECFVPDMGQFDRGQRVQTTRIDVEGLDLDLSIHHAAEQRVDSQHASVEDGKVRTYPVVIRYAWPSELDLMARIAGLHLKERWGGWKREPFGDDSGRHVPSTRTEELV
jgi:SAM-dependent methyltransferase